MQCSPVRTAQERLKNANWPSSYTTKAIALLDKNPSEDELLESLHNQPETPVTLEALCALQPESQGLYHSVCQAIASHPRLSWCLVDSLNHLAWYDGMRAFLDPPSSVMWMHLVG